MAKGRKNAATLTCPKTAGRSGTRTGSTRHVRGAHLVPASWAEPLCSQDGMIRLGLPQRPFWSWHRYRFNSALLFDFATFMVHALYGTLAMTDAAGDLIQLFVAPWPQTSNDPSNAPVGLWVQVYWEIDRFSKDCPPKETSLVHVISTYGISQILPAILQGVDQNYLCITSVIDTRDESG